MIYDMFCTETVDLGMINIFIINAVYYRFHLLVDTFREREV